MRRIEEITKQAVDAISSVHIPQTWKFEGYDKTRLTTDDNSEITSIGAIYTDKATKGIQLKKYRIFYHIPGEHLGIVQRDIIDYSKTSYSCLISNKSVGQINDFITDYFNDKNT